MDINALSEQIRAALGQNVDVRSNGNGGSGISINLTPANLLAIIQKRPGADKIQRLRANDGLVDSFLSTNWPSSPDNETRVVCCSLFKSKAEKSFAKKQFREARDRYLDATASIVGKKFKIPLPANGGLRNDVYEKIDTWETISLMECCNGLARCAIRLGNIEEAIEWVGEVYVLWKNRYFRCGTVHFEWINYNQQITEYFLECVIAFRIASEIFLDIGNTGTSVQRRLFGHLAATSMPSNLDEALVRKQAPIDSIIDFTKLRHPEPQLSGKLTMQRDALQVLGSWKKVAISKASSLPQRSGFASFVWNGYLYVLGGQKKLPDLAELRTVLSAYLRDFWRINLSQLKAWEQLPSYPPSDVLQVVCGYSMAVHADKAYLFTGFPKVDYFDLITGKWESINTRFKREDGLAGGMPWLYPSAITDYAMQMVDGHLYVFGGSHKDASLGCNLFVVLDLKTREWTRLSGTVQPEPDYSCPGPRKWPASWVAGDQMFIMYGVADRQGAQMHDQKHAADEAFGYSDYWSWNFITKKWRMEKVNGNAPCPRAEAGCTYNSKLNQTILFGGYAPTFSTLYLELGKSFNFSYYADTFIWSPTTSKWKQVLTRGFPTYRAQSALITDPSTGKVFLFGGYTNNDYVQSRKDTFSKSFADLWQLRIDQPGGYFEGVDLEEEARTAKAGPWQRCFSCGGAGQWKQCGGSCKGRAFFCDVQCLRDGWKEHKAIHNCRK